MVDNTQTIIISSVVGGIVLIAGIAGGIYAFYGNTGVPLPTETPPPMSGGKRRKTHRHKRK